MPFSHPFSCLSTLSLSNEDWKHLWSYLIIPTLPRQLLSLWGPVWIVRLTFHPQKRWIPFYHVIFPVHGPLWQILYCPMWQNPLSCPNIFSPFTSALGIPGPVAWAWPVGRDRSVAIILPIQTCWHSVWGIAKMLVLDGIRQAWVVEPTSEKRAIWQPIDNTKKVMWPGFLLFWIMFCSTYLKWTLRNPSFWSAEERLGGVGLGTPDSTDESESWYRPVVRRALFCRRANERLGFWPGTNRVPSGTWYDALRRCSFMRAYKE